MSIVNAPIEGAVMVGGTIGNGGVAFSDGFPSVVGKSSPVRIVHCGNYATVYDDIILADGEPGSEDGFYIPGANGIISIIGYESNIKAGNMSRTSALGDNSQIELSYMTEPSVPDYGLNESTAYVAGSASRIIARDVVKNSTLISSGATNQILDEGSDNTIICTGSDAEVITGENALLVVTSNKCSFTPGVGAVTVFCWKDGDVKQVTVVREGENGISAGTDYVFENGNIQIGL